MLPPELDVVVHATHEAGAKVGGIGAVLDGILSDSRYNQVVRRTLLVGPLFSNDQAQVERLHSPESGMTMLYSNRDGICQIDPSLARALEQIELYYHVELIYGRRQFGQVSHEVVLVDPREAVSNTVNRFKYHLWETYGIESQRYESNPEYERFIAAAEPSLAAVMALTGEGEYPRPPVLRAPAGGRRVLIAHDWLGLPLAFAARWKRVSHPTERNWRTVLYAHEVPSVRRVVEDDPGHDTRFYNVMRAAERQNLFFDQVFGDQRDFFKHALLTAGVRLDGVFTVSDITLAELRFLSPAFASRPISIIYGGIPQFDLPVGAREASRERLKEYGASLTGHKPTWVFTHVSRLTTSKALWRDLRVMEELDRLLTARGESALLITLSSAVPSGRRIEDVRRWEREYGWPLSHRADNGDLVGPEIDYYAAIEDYNARARAGRIVLINQFGWGPARLGRRPTDSLEPDDLRTGTDLEFGQSIYEPFGIGALEPLSAGAICCLSSVSGSMGLLRQSGHGRLPNTVNADYVSLPPSPTGRDLAALLQIGQGERDAIERAEAERIAERIDERLPRTPEMVKRLLDDGAALARDFSWNKIVEQSFLPALFGLY